MSGAASDLYGFSGGGRVPGFGHGQKRADLCHYEKDHPGDPGIVYLKLAVSSLWSGLRPAGGGVCSDHRGSCDAQKDF